MNKYHVNIDSGFQPQITLQALPVQQTLPGVTGVSFVNYVENNVIKNGGNTFDLTYRFMNTHRSLKRIALKNLQLPYGFYNIRSGTNTILINSTIYTVVSGYYTQSQLLTALNASTSPTSTVLSSDIGSFSAVSQSGTSPNNLQFTPATGKTALFGSSLLNTILGFTSGQTASAPTIIPATNLFNYNFDTYVYISINNLGFSSQEPIKYTFKVPLNNTSFGSTLYWADEGQNHQVVEVTDNSVRVDRLQIQVLDRYGNVLNNNGLDWSMTLEITSDT